MTLVPLDEHNAQQRHARWRELNTGLPLCNIACPKCGAAMMVGFAVSEEESRDPRNNHGGAAFIGNERSYVTCPKCWHLDLARKGANGV